MPRKKIEPPPVDNLISNVLELGDLLAFHTYLGGKGPGRRRLGVLNKSAIVLLVASWEAFVEDIAELAFTTLIKDAASATTFPNVVLANVARELKNDQNDIAVWALADAGWRAVLQSYKQAICKRYIGKLNTPRPDNVDEMFEKLIGLKSASKRWIWQGRTAASATKTLEDLITLRGSIAHRVTTSRAVTKKDVIDARDFIGCLVAKTSNIVGNHVSSCTKKASWAIVRYGKVA